MLPLPPKPAAGIINDDRLRRVIATHQAQASDRRTSVRFGHWS